uniref:Uncharacterized protein n=1 Tax=Hanusia phi TaxID=3032 RepID=A0A7S0HT04_9CRYP
MTDLDNRERILREIECQLPLLQPDGDKLMLDHVVQVHGSNINTNTSFVEKSRQDGSFLSRASKGQRKSFSSQTSAATSRSARPPSDHWLFYGDHRYNVERDVVKSYQNQLPLLSLEDEDVGSMSDDLQVKTYSQYDSLARSQSPKSLPSPQSPGANVSSVRMKLKTTEADLLNDKEYLISAIKLEVEQNLSVDRGRISIIIRSKSKGVINVEIQISDDEQQSLAMKLLSSIQEGSCRGTLLSSAQGTVLVQQSPISQASSPGRDRLVQSHGLQERNPSMANISQQWHSWHSGTNQNFNSSIKSYIGSSSSSSTRTIPMTRQLDANIHRVSIGRTVYGEWPGVRMLPTGQICSRFPGPIRIEKAGSNVVFG